jgi:hypothetical protein
MRWAFDLDIDYSTAPAEGNVPMRQSPSLAPGRWHPGN